MIEKVSPGRFALNEDVDGLQLMADVLHFGKYCDRRGFLRLFKSPLREVEAAINVLRHAECVVEFIHSEGSDAPAAWEWSFPAVDTLYPVHDAKNLIRQIFETDLPTELATPPTP